MHYHLLSQPLPFKHFTGNLLLFLMLISFVSPSIAVSISTQRIYLDQKKSNERFVVSNKTTKVQSCKLDLTHFYFNESGSLLEYKKNEQPLNSAQEFLRFSPKRFDVQARGRQTVRFVMRRKNIAIPKEYRSYLVVNCEDKIKQNETKQNSDELLKITMKPQLVHNVPIIVRPKKISNTNVSFENVSLNNNTLNFTVLRSGDRSVFGHIEIHHKKSKALITTSGKFSLYPETTKKNVNLKVNTDIAPNEWTIKFIEDKNYGGTLVAEYNLDKS